MVLKMLCRLPRVVSTTRKYSSRSRVAVSCLLDDLAKTPNQSRYVTLLKKDSVKIVVATGPAGTGKTLIGCSYAIQGLMNKEISKVIITRPAVAMEEDLGYLPGKMEEKMHHWLTPIYDSFTTFVSLDKVRDYIKAGKIEIAPLGFMRGRTFHNSWIIVDEAQNINCSQMKTLLTRIGNNSKIILAGDLEQCDLKQGPNGLDDFVTKLNRYPKQCYSIQIVEMDETDIMRSDVVRDVLDIYNQDLNLDYEYSSCHA